VFNMDLLRTRVPRMAEDSGGVQDNRVHRGQGERGSSALILHQKLGVPTRLRVASLRFRGHKFYCCLLLFHHHMLLMHWSRR
jgi:hypothetical protein